MRILACPFCGKLPACYDVPLLGKPKGWEIWHRCESGLIVKTGTCKTKKEAIEIWNRRTYD